MIQLICICAFRRGKLFPRIIFELYENYFFT